MVDLGQDLRAVREENKEAARFVHAAGADPDLAVPPRTAAA